MNNIFNETQPGALLDTRTQAEQDKDWKFGEIVSTTAPVNWVTKPQGEWRKFPIFNQNGSGSCVAQTLRKMAGAYIWLKTGVFVILSASHIYQRRENKPAPGMSGVDVFEIGRKGVTLEQFAPSENMSDGQMDGINVIPFMDEVGKVFRLGNYFVGPIKDIETIASIIQTTGKAVMVWFYFQVDEWGNVPVIKNASLDQNAYATLRHSVAAVDFTMYEGEKAIIIDESWGQNSAMNGQRVIKESFFKERNFFTAHFMNLAFEEATVPKPHFYFAKDLDMGMKNTDVNGLQDCLKYEGMYPINTDSTGYFGSVTKTAVMKFQAKYGISQAGRVGPLTRDKLNEIFNT